MPNNNEEPNERERRMLSIPDGKWHIVAIIATTTFFAVAATQTSDYIKMMFIEKFQVHETTASLPGTILSTLPDAVGLLVGPLQRIFSVRSVMITGSILAWFGIMVSGFVNNFPSMSATLGVLHGVGSGTVLVSVYLLTMMHFSKFRGVTRGAASLGIPLSGLAFTELLHFFQGAYGARGSLFLLGALSMHLTPLTCSLGVPFPSKVPAAAEPAASEGGTNDSIEMREFGRPKLGLAQSSRCHSDFGVMFARPAFYIVVISSAITAVIDSIFLNTVIDFAVDQGSVKSDAAWLKPCYSAANAFGRILLPLIADKEYVRRSTFVMLSHVLVGVTLVVAPIATKYWMIAILCALTAAFLGGAAVSHEVLVVDYLSLERLSGIHGTIGLVKAPLIICSPFLIDALHDISGSHSILYRTKGGLLLFLSLIWLSVVCGERKHQLKLPPSTSK